MNFFSGGEKVNELFTSVEEKKASRSRNNISESRCELKANRAGEEQSDEQAGILSDNISGTSDSAGYWVIRNILHFYRQGYITYIIDHKIVVKSTIIISKKDNNLFFSIISGTQIVEKSFR